jgi:hypothetical protein
LRRKKSVRERETQGNREEKEINKNAKAYECRDRK